MPSLNPARWAALSPQIDELLTLPPLQRAQRLNEIAANDLRTAEELRELLAAGDAASHVGFMGAAADAAFVPAAAAPQAQAGWVLGAWTLEAAIGEGGMGAVWRARRSDGRYEGLAAIKLLKSGLFDTAAQERFRREGAILARLHHTGIAQLLDAGVSPQGQPYLVLEWVQGQRIDHWCEAQGLDVRQRIELFLQVLDAVQAAHAQLAIHRDLKPSNILVDDSGHVKLLDFGIARLLPEAQAEQTALTREGSYALTPEYAAPEQFEGGVLSVATDVYGVGVVLFELLTGAHPLAIRPGATPLQWMQAVQEGPRQRASVVAPAARRAALRGDLDVILDKTLRRLPVERYAGVAALADDLRAHLAFRPVAARPEALLYRLSRTVRRHRAGVALGALALLAVVAGVAGTVLQAAEARAQAARATQQEQRARGAAAESERLRAVAVDQTAAAAREAEHAVAAARQAEAERQRADLEAAKALRAAADARRDRDRAVSERDHAESTSEFIGFLLTEGGETPLKPTELLARAATMIDRQFRDDAAQRARMTSLVASQYAELDDHKAAAPLAARAASAASLTRMPILQAEMDCLQARVDGLTGEAAPAMARLDARIAGLRAQPQPDETALVQCLVARSTVASEAAGPAIALADADAALARMNPPRAGQRTLWLNARNAKAAALIALGRPAAAAAEFKSVLEDYDRNGRGDTAAARAVLGNMGAALGDAGQMLAALAAMERAEQIRARTGSDGNGSSSATGLANLATPMLRVGRRAEAMRIFEDAYEIARQQPGQRVLGSAALRLASALCTVGELDRCGSTLDVARSALGATLARGNPVLASLDLVQARLALARQQPQQALPLLESALAAFQKATAGNPSQIRVLLLLSETERGLGHLDAARAYTQQASAEAKRYSGDFATSDWYGSVLMEEAQIAQASGQQAQASALAQSALMHLRGSLGADAPAVQRMQALAAAWGTR